MKQGMASLTEIESNECQDPQQDPQRRLGTGKRSKERLSVFDSFPNCLRARVWWWGEGLVLTTAYVLHQKMRFSKLSIVFWP